MKKVIVFCALLAALVVNISWMMEGCTGTIPALSAVVATSTPTLGPQWVANFEGGTATLNSNLVASNNPNFNFLPTTGGVNVVSPGANGTNFCLNLMVAAKVLSGYAPYEIEANPNSTGLYNLYGTAYGSATNGIKFYWKTGTDDTMPARWIIIPVPEQIPPSVGDCPGTGGGCYDTFKKPLSATGGAWTLVSFTWSQFAQTGWGFPQVGSLSSTCGVAPCTGSPNLSRILYFQWEEDPNGTTGTYGADSFIDEVQLF